MERKPPSTLGEFFAVIRRRKYWIIVPSLVVTVLALVIASFLPRTYQSTTTLMLEPQKVPTVFVRSGTTNDDVANRLKKIEMEVMSGTGFAQIIKNLNLYPDMRTKMDMSHLVAAMRQDITVAPAPDSPATRDGVMAFTISYVGSNPRTTQQATNDIADLFILENQKEGHQQAQRTEAFLQAQVAEARQHLADQQAKIQAFKEAHFGSMPEQAQANMQMIGQYQADLQTNSAAIDQDNQQRVYLRSVLNVQANGDQSEAALAPATPLQIELAQKQAELQADLLKYTPQYPDVIRLKHDIAELKIQIQHEPKSTAVISPTGVPTGPTPTDQLRSQLVALNGEIQVREARQKEMQQKLQQLQGSVATSPAAQTQFDALDSDYQEMQKSYNLLLEKEQEAAMAAALDQHDDTAQFLVLQPANFPTTPHFPNPILVYMGSVLLGIFVGFVCAGIVEMRDDTMHDADEVGSYLKLPVMVALPKFVP